MPNVAGIVTTRAEANDRGGGVTESGVFAEPMKSVTANPSAVTNTFNAALGYMAYWEQGVRI